MNNLQNEYILSLFETLTIISKNNKNTVELVKSSLDNNIYIKKTLKIYNINVYNTLKELNNKSLPKIYYIIEDNSSLILIEEFINGKTLEDIIEDNDPLSIDLSIKYILDLISALSLLHNLNPPIIHRDIKPSNIIITNDGILKLIDFDTARIFSSNINKDTYLLGTEGYAAPEQYGFSQTDCRTDIYSIGVLLNYLLTKQHPNEKLLNNPISDIIKKCTSISPDNRYNSLSELKESINNIYINYDKIHTIDNTTTSTKLNNYSLPGFRGSKYVNKVIGAFVYLFLIYGGLSNITTANPLLILQDITTAIALFLIILLCNNYLDIQSKLPFFDRSDKASLYTSIGLYSTIILLIAGFILNI